MPGQRVLLRRECITALGAAEVAPRCFVLIFDAMLPRQRMRITADEHGQLFIMLAAALNHYQTYSVVPQLAPRLGMVGVDGVDARSQHQLRAPSAPPTPNPCGVEITIESWTDSELTLVGGRPFELLELVRYHGDTTVSEFDPRVVWDVFDCQDPSKYMLARVNWLPLKRVSAAAVKQIEDQLKPQVVERFCTWGMGVRMGGLEKFQGQLDTILRDLGPCPPATEPEAACLWLAALLNPLPALGVAPEIRGHVLCRRGFAARNDALLTGLNASLQNVMHFVPIAHERRVRSGAPEPEPIDVCRVS